MRLLPLMLAAACGASSPSERTTQGDAVVAIPNMDGFSQTARIPLESGELLLGASPNVRDIAIIVQAQRGRLILFACDRLEAETADNGFELARVGYDRNGDLERLGGMVPRDRLQRLVDTAAPRLQTCDEEIELDDAQIRSMRAFLSGRPPPPEETFESRSIALEGLDMGLAISNLEPDVVRISLRIIEPHVSLDDCEVVAIVNGDMFPMGLLSLEPGGPNPRRHDQLEARFPRRNVQLLAMEDQASFIVCGDVWLLDELTLGNIRSLVGSPD